MKKRRWLIALLVIFCILFVFTDSVGANENEKEFNELIAEQKKVYQSFESENKKISAVLDKILDALNKEQKSYQEVKKFRNLARHAESLLSENEKLLKNVANEKDKQILAEMLLKIGNNFTKVSLIHRLLTNILLAIFSPLFGEDPPPPETVL